MLKLRCSLFMDAHHNRMQLGLRGHGIQKQKLLFGHDGRLKGVL